MAEDFGRQSVGSQTHNDGSASCTDEHVGKLLQLVKELFEAGMKYKYIIEQAISEFRAKPIAIFLDVGEDEIQEWLIRRGKPSIDQVEKLSTLIELAFKYSEDDWINLEWFDDGLYSNNDVCKVSQNIKMRRILEQNHSEMQDDVRDYDRLRTAIERGIETLIPAKEVYQWLDDQKE